MNLLRHTMLRVWTVVWMLGVPIFWGCVQQAPPDLVQAVEVLDRQLGKARSAEFAPEEYGRFVQHWVALKERLRADDQIIGWPWEDNQFVTDLRAIHQDGTRVLAVATRNREAERRDAAKNVARLERRLQRFTSHMDEIGSRAALGQRRVETELLIRQARSLLEQEQFVHAVKVSQQAAESMAQQAALLSAELGRYADAKQVAEWRTMVRRTVEWSRSHQAAAVVVTKADHRLTLYRNGQAVASFSVRLGYNGVLEKRYEDDGATPEGAYRVIRKRDHGQTEFHRALLLDYPNADDHRRFQLARKAGTIPPRAQIGGNIEIHGEANRQLSETLGCAMLSDRQMDVLFREVEVGTPVTIVGAVDVNNAVSLALAQLDEGDDPEDDSTEIQDAAVEGDATVEQG